jgi:hypothetical protein
LIWNADVYAAKANPGLEDIVKPWGPGYDKIVEALGGKTLIPPVWRDPKTGESRSNPLVTRYDGQDTPRRVEVTAVCLAPSPRTGEIVGSVHTVVLDVELIARQALLKEAGSTAAQGDPDTRGSGWCILWPDHAPIPSEYDTWARFKSGRVTILANLRRTKIVDILRDMENNAKSAVGRATTMARRLACEANQVVRRQFLYGQVLEGGDGVPPRIEHSFDVWDGPPVSVDFVGSFVDQLANRPAQLSASTVEFEDAEWGEDEREAIAAMEKAEEQVQTAEATAAVLDAAEAPEADPAPEDDEPEPDLFTQGVPPKHSRIAGQVQRLLGPMARQDIDSVLTDAGTIGLPVSDWTRPQWVAVREAANKLLEQAQPGNWAAEVEREYREMNQ